MTLAPAISASLMLLGLAAAINSAAAQQAMTWRVNGVTQSLPLTNGTRAPIIAGSVYELSFTNLPTGAFINGPAAEFNLGFGATNGSPDTSVFVEMFNPGDQSPFHTNTFKFDSAGWRFRDVTRTIGTTAPVLSWLGPSGQFWQSNAGSLRFTVSGGTLVLRTILLRVRTPTTTYAVTYTGAPSTNMVLTAEKSSALTNAWQPIQISPDMITPQGELNVGPTTNTNEFYRLNIRTLVQ